MVLHSISFPGKGTARHTRSSGVQRCRHCGEALFRSARRGQREAVSDDIRGTKGHSILPQAT